MSLKDKDKIEIFGKRSQLAHLRNFIANAAKKFNIGLEIIDDLIIAVDEACSNIIDHTYKKNLKDKIKIEYYIYKTMFKVIIYDKGVEFDPVQHKLPDVDRHLKILKSRGLGIFIMKKLIDKMEHEYIPGKGNKLTLIKKISIE